MGYCDWRKAERIFAVERIREVKMLATHFTVRPGFDAEEYLEHARGVLKGEIVPVEVIFSVSAARYVRDRVWHASQKFRDLSDGRLEVTRRVADTLEVRRWILGYGSDVEFLEPAGMREGLCRQAEGFARDSVEVFANVIHGPPTRTESITQAKSLNSVRDERSAE